MKLGLVLGYAGGADGMNLALVKEAEALGYDSVWTSEAYGSDAVTAAAWVLAQTTKINVGTAIMQMPARTPAMAAMTAMTLQDLSQGRFIMGLGASGPQVVEGWHGVPYGRPMTRTKEYISIIRKILERKEPVTHEGYHYQIPYKGEGATGLGKPLKSILHGDPSLKIVTASITDAGMRTSGEVADGVIPVWMDPSRYDLFEPFLEEGFAKVPGKSLENFEVTPFVSVVMGNDIDACRQPVKDNLALYIGGMGARAKNFYNDYAIRLGYADEAKVIQDLYLSGKKKEAAAQVPDSLVDETALVGPREHIAEQLKAWKAASEKRHISSLLVRPMDTTGVDASVLRVLAEEVL
ncbi:MAG TPA: LLM class F420-dependent oxidoreductase [Gammaproteobacteria bacterium]|nr:LLM class F420-dependent oxidoreductase [Gammaproteobacteria bacterium]